MTEVTFRNQIKIKVLVQIFAGRDNFSTGFVNAGESFVLSAESLPYDIYCKDAVSGWEVGHKLSCHHTSIALRSEKGRYVVAGGKE
jgi:hypothetical protein